MDEERDQGGQGVVGVRARSRKPGRQLAELQIYTAALGTQLVRSLEAGFEEVETSRRAFPQGAGGRDRETPPRAEADKASHDMRRRSTEAAREMWRAASKPDVQPPTPRMSARAWGMLGRAIAGPRSNVRRRRRRQHRSEARERAASWVARHDAGLTAEQRDRAVDELHRS